MLQVVTAANIIGAGNGLEVGSKLELLSIRGAEAEAEQDFRIGIASMQPALGQALPMQVLVTISRS